MRTGIVTNSPPFPPSFPPSLVCHDCDHLQARPTLAPGELALCARCGRVLARGSRNVASRTLALALASLLLFVLANAFPLMEFRIAGRSQVARLITGVLRLYREGYQSMALLVFFTSFVAPAAFLLGLFSVSLPMATGRRYGWMWSVARWITKLRAWSMMEVFMLAVIVSVVKLSDGAEIIFGQALFALAGLILTSTAAISVFDPDTLWRYMEREERP